MGNKNSRNKTPLWHSATVESIEDFSDDILIHILSFLPTKEAFKTSVLSKRWLPLCCSLSVLDIEGATVNNSKDWILFRRSMDAIMFSPCSHHLTLKYFCLSYVWETYNAECFDKWIEAAKQRRVETLVLLLLHVPLAPTTFCCETLVVLDLINICVAAMFHCSVHLPLLKTLKLDVVQFEDMEDYMKLLSGCPILEYLKSVSVKANAGVTSGGYCKPLSKLIKATIPLLQMGKILDNEQINSFYKGFHVFENLIDLRLSWFYGIHDWDKVVKMLHNCPKLQTLTITKDNNLKTIEDWKYPYQVPECVTSHLTTCQIIQYDALEADFRFATYILQNARLLQVMTIRRNLQLKPMASLQFFQNLVSCPRISPACKLSFLY